MKLKQIYVFETRKHFKTIKQKNKITKTQMKKNADT